MHIYKTGENDVQARINAHLLKNNLGEMKFQEIYIIVQAIFETNFVVML